MACAWLTGEKYLFICLKSENMIIYTLFSSRNPRMRVLLARPSLAQDICGLVKWKHYLNREFDLHHTHTRSTSEEYSNVMAY
jgi:hypothetical protein